jgi:uncharacterized membrane protein YGL010W
MARCVTVTGAPALFSNLSQALLMAPLFVLIELCFSVGIFHNLESTVSKAADKRRTDMDKTKTAKA